MLDEIIGYHRWAAEGLLAVMVINLLIPYGMRQNIVRMIFWMRVGYFAFWAFWTMTAFAGVIDWMFTQRALPGRVIVMIVAALILPVMDGYRAIRLKRLWLSGDDGSGFNTVVVGGELVLTLVAFLYGLYG